MMGGELRCGEARSEKVRSVEMRQGYVNECENLPTYLPYYLPTYLPPHKITCSYDIRSCLN